MDRLNRYFKRAKEKFKNKLMPRVIRSIVASGESLTGDDAHSGASSPSQHRALIDPTVAEQGAIDAGTTNSMDSAQRPRSEVCVGCGGLDTGISRPRSPPDRMTSK
jgi:hypothetical protein